MCYGVFFINTRISGHYVAFILAPAVGWVLEPSAGGAAVGIHFSKLCDIKLPKVIFSRSSYQPVWDSNWQFCLWLQLSSQTRWTPSWILVYKQANLNNQNKLQGDFGLKMTVYLDIYETFFNFRPLSCQLMVAILDFSIFLALAQLTDEMDPMYQGPYLYYISTYLPILDHPFPLL